MTLSKYKIALFRMKASQDEELEYASYDIEQYVEELLKEQTYLCCRITSLTMSRDEHKKELDAIKDTP